MLAVASPQAKASSIDARSQQSLLLKPTGAPVFLPIEDQQTIKISQEEEAVQPGQRTVRAQSFVIGKRIQNQTGIELIEGEQKAAERQFPIKVIYQKPSFVQKQHYLKGNGTGSTGDLPENKENKAQNRDLKSDIPKLNAISSASKISEQKHRPKSASTQQLKRDQLQRTKLGPDNSKVKPQVSYISKAQVKKRPQTAAAKPPKKEEEVPAAPAKEVQIPFAQNRFQGQHGSLTKDLVKKAQEALKEEKSQQEKARQDAQAKKEKERQLQEEVRKKNSELVREQREKGAQRVDFRKREEEEKEKLRKEENKLERERRLEARKKRKEEGRKVLGLENFDQEYLEEQMRKIKEMQAMNQTQEQTKDISIKKPSQSTKPLEQKLHLFRNQDLKDQFKDALKKEGDAQEEEEKKSVDKKKLLKEQKQKRKQEQFERQQKEEQEKLKRLQQMEALEERQRKQKEEYLKRREEKQRAREEEERREREQEERSQQRKKGRSKKAKSESHTEKMSELKSWIEEQMQREDIREEMGQEEDLQIMEPVKEVKIDRKSEKKDEEEANQQKMMKLMLPGNHLLAEKEERSLGARDNRYGLQGDNGYGQMVEIQRDKMAEKLKREEEEQKKKKKKMDRQEKKKIKNFLVEKIKEIQKQADGGVKDEHSMQDIVDIKDKSMSSESKPNPNRLIIIEKQNSPSKAPIPGILSIEQELHQQKLAKDARELSATKTIQRWARGFLGRRHARDRRFELAQRIEEEYGQFKDQVKFNSDYNLEKFLRQKRKMRQEESGGIRESIRESGKMSMEVIEEKIGVEERQVKVQNYFLEIPGEKDPLSLISIFAKKHAPKQPSHHHPQKHKHHSTDHRHPSKKQSTSDIEEEIYSDNFDEGSMQKRVTSQDEDIDEDIVEGSKGMSSQGSRHRLQVPQKQAKKEPFQYKLHNADESISEDIPMSVAGGDSQMKRSPGADSSILEESNLNQMSGSRRSSVKKRQRQFEESIKEEVSQNYENEGFDSYSGSASMARGKKQQAELHRFQEEVKAKDDLRKGKINEMLQELQRYEQASVSTILVERLEKIVSMSLSQKDKLLLGQRLHELEAEKQHQAEIARIREEQMKLMAQVMAAGTGAGEEQKQQVLDTINKIIEKPVTIVHEEKKNSSSSHQTYEEKESDEDYIAESKALANQNNYDDDDSGSIKESIDPKDSIEEDVPSGKDASSDEEEDEIKESVYVDGVPQEEAGLSKMRMQIGSEEEIRKQSKKSLKKSQGHDSPQRAPDEDGIFAKNSYEQFLEKKFRELMVGEANVAGYIREVKAQVRERERQQKRKLKKELKNRLISPRTFQRKEQEIEKWVQESKKEIKSKKSKMIEGYQEMISKLEKDKKSMLEKIGSPHRLGSSSSSLQASGLESDSADSYRVRYAKNQLHRLEEELKSGKEKGEGLEKRKLVAKKLLEEKEKAIEEGLKEKLRNIEVEHIDQLLEKAIKMDVDTEIERRLLAARRHVEESHQSEMDYYESTKSLDESKKRKKVNFASPEVAPSNQSSSYRSYRVQEQQQVLNTMGQDSIEESIKYDESIVSQSMPQLQESKRSQSNKEGLRSGHLQMSMNASAAIHESIKEEESGKYTENFDGESSLSSKQKSKKDSVRSSNKDSSGRFSSAKKDQNLEESLAEEIEYSQNFDSEALGESNNLESIKQSKANQKSEFSAVKEESEEHKSSNSYDSDHYSDTFVDATQSLRSTKKLEEMQQSASPSPSPLEEAPSEPDKEIQESTRSVEWKLVLVQEEEPEPTKEEEPNSNQGDSDIDNLEDLESCPDDMDNSADNFDRQADFMTDELLQAILQNVLESDVSALKEIEQTTSIEGFEDKFPFNLEEPAKVEEAKPQPIISVHMKSSPMKTQEQLQQERFDRHQAFLRDDQKHVEAYLELIAKNIDLRELVQALEKPIQKDPLRVLAQIQEADYEESQSMKFRDSIMLAQNKVLQYEYFKLVENLYRAKHFDAAGLTESGEEKKLLNEYWYHKAIFDAFNLALDQERPYQQGGQPNPWSKQNRHAVTKISQAQAQLIISKAKARVLKQSRTFAGTQCAPLPPPPPLQNDYEPSPPAYQPTEEERKNQAREEKLGDLLTKEIEEQDKEWTDYENEDTQTKFDLADMILSDLASEVALLLNAKFKQTNI